MPILFSITQDEFNSKIIQIKFQLKFDLLVISCKQKWCLPCKVTSPWSNSYLHCQSKPRLTIFTLVSDHNSNFNLHLTNLQKILSNFVLMKRPRCFDRFWSATEMDRILARSQLCKIVLIQTNFFSLKT